MELFARLRRFFDRGQNSSSPVLQATIIEPTQKETKAGLVKLRQCVPVWKVTPALLVEKPDLAVIVSVRDVTHTRTGFRILLDVNEVLMAPVEFGDRCSLELACVWNQPYMSFSDQSVFAPYSFSLQFGREGVARARELCVSLPTMNEGLKVFLPGLLKSCFGVGRPYGLTEDQFQRMRQAFISSASHSSK
jgi:hypothetical protein